MKRGGFEEAARLAAPPGDGNRNAATVYVSYVDSWAMHPSQGAGRLPDGGHGGLAPARGPVQRDAPPIFFLRHQKDCARKRVSEANRP